MRKLSDEYNDNPMTAAQKIVYWTEYVIRHKGTPHLRTMGANMPFYQYLYIDVIVYLAVVSSAIILSVFYAVKILRAILVVKNTFLRAKKLQ